MGTKTDREFSYDLIRVLAMIFVIGVHLPLEFTDNIWIFTIKSAVFLTCNGMFYMLSGKFNLSKKFEISLDYINFYKKKFVDIIFPFIVWTCFLYLYDSKSSLMNMDLREVGTDFLRTALVINTTNHIWFMYPLMGLLLSTPFLAKLINNLNEKEIHILFGTGMAWEVVTVILIDGVANLSNPFSGWFLESWIFYFTLGGMYERIVNNKKKLKKFIIVGLIMLVLTVLWVIWLPDRSSRAYDLSPAYTLVTMGIFLLVENRISISNKCIKRGITFIAKHSYSIYFVHQLVINWTGYHLRIITGLGGYLIKYMVVIFISLICAIIADQIVINPCKRILKKCLKIQNSGG